jgi:phage terminase small subunit
MAHNLNDRQLKFCQNYLKDPNGTHSAIKAGYSKKTAEVTASKLLRNVKIKAYLDKHRAKAEEKAQISAEYVADCLKEVMERCLQKVPVQEYDKTTGMMVDTGEWKFEGHNVISAAKALQDQFGYKSIEKKEVDINVTVFTGVPEIKRDKK